MPVPWLHLFKPDDQPWFPAAVRNLATDRLHLIEARSADRRSRGLPATVAGGRAAGYPRAMSDVTRLLDAAAGGDPRAAADLLPLACDELRKLAARRFAQERAGQTLDATALVHEVYLRLVNPDPGQPWNGRAHFFGAAAEATRRILVDRARRKHRPKQGGDRDRLDLDERALPLADDRTQDLLALDEALTALSRQEPAKAELVKLRDFAGRTLEEAADCLGISLATVKRHWAFARAWLFTALSGRPKAAD